MWNFVINYFVILRSNIFLWDAAAMQQNNNNDDSLIFQQHTKIQRQVAQHLNKNCKHFLSIVYGIIITEFSHVFDSWLKLFSS